MMTPPDLQVPIRYPMQTIESIAWFERHYQYQLINCQNLTVQTRLSATIQPEKSTLKLIEKLNSLGSLTIYN